MGNMIAVCLLYIFSALCFDVSASTQDVPSQEWIQKFPHITAMQAYVLFNQKGILLLDVHDGGYRSKILGALYLPSKKIKDLALKIPRNQVIGIFCD